MKSKRISGIILALTATLGLILAACDNGSTSDSEPAGDPKTIRITGFTESAPFNGTIYDFRMAMITLHRSLVSDEAAAAGATRLISSASALTFPLYDSDFIDRWNGSGDYVVLLIVCDVAVDSSEEITAMNKVRAHVYSPGVIPNQAGNNIPKYSITEAVSTIGFANSFYDVTDLFPDDLINGW